MTNPQARLGPYLTVAEVQAIARCSRSTVMRAIAYGDLAAHKAHGRRLINEPELARWIEAGCPVTHPADETSRVAS